MSKGQAREEERERKRGRWREKQKREKQKNASSSRLLSSLFAGITPSATQITISQTSMREQRVLTRVATGSNGGVEKRVVKEGKKTVRAMAATSERRKRATMTTLVHHLPSLFPLPPSPLTARPPRPRPSPGLKKPWRWWRDERFRVSRDGELRRTATKGHTNNSSVLMFASFSSFTFCSFLSSSLSGGESYRSLRLCLAREKRSKRREGKKQATTGERTEAAAAEKRRGSRRRE